MTRSTVFFLLGAVLLGPVAALLVTWIPPLAVTRIDGGVIPSDQQIERMREVPTDERLSELRWMAVGAPAFVELRGQEAVRVAQRMLDGHADPSGLGRPVAVPFRPDAAIFGPSTWSLRLCSLAVPSLLSRAYEVSGDTQFLEAAVRYVLDWSHFEEGLWLPKGYVFNDHATAARAVVLTELWRVYRQSDIYRAEDARALLRYVRKTLGLLQADWLYEFRTNHGLMQSLSLLHLATAFPVMTDAESNARLAADRLLAQMEYFIGPEGAILENSAGYHHFFAKGAAAAWRYMGFWNFPVPEKFVRRYKKAVELDDAMLRPDRTLPPVGDTGDAPFNPLPTAIFDEQLVASRPLVVDNNGARPSAALTLLPIDGYAVIWQGLERWPESTSLSQTVLHWNDFPTRAHKHADELGLSIWAGGSQWVTAVGGWPFDATRANAIGWRSSNAPHWLGESWGSERVASLLSYGVSDDLGAFDVARNSPEGGWIRRQLVHTDDFVWVVVDAMHDETGRAGETIWRFRHDVLLRQLDSGRFLLEKPGQLGTMELAFSNSEDWKIEPDVAGDAAWNSGIMVGATTTPSPAIRLSTNDASPVIAAVFRWRATADTTDTASELELHWQDPETWTLTSRGEGEIGLSVERNAASVAVLEPAGRTRTLAVAPPQSEAAALARQASIASYEEAVKRYGRPFSPIAARRTKVTLAIAGAVVLQTIAFFVMPLRLRRWRPFVTGVTIFAWLSLAAFLHLVFLA